MIKKISPLAIVACLFMTFAFSSCVSLSKLSYFNDLEMLDAPIVNPQESKKIKPFDMLYIRIVSSDTETAGLLNYYESTEGAMVPANVMAYTVDANGDIEIKFVGKINVVGLTIEEAELKIKDALTNVISTYTVVVRFYENNISILGHVANPGVFSFITETITVYEALSMAGGIVETGDRKKVVLIRQDGDKISHYKLDLSNSQIANQSYYYLQPRDVLVVEPNRIATRNFNLSNTTSIISMLISTLTLYFLILRLSPTNSGTI